MNLVIPYVFRHVITKELVSGRTLIDALGDRLPGTNVNHWEIVTKLPKEERCMFQPDGSPYPHTPFNDLVLYRAEKPGPLTIVLNRVPRLVRIYVADGSRVIFDGGDLCESQCSPSN